MRTYLKDLRVNAELTQAEMAKKLGISESYYSLIENGHRKNDLTTAMAQQISKIFGITIGKVFELENHCHKSLEKQSR